MLAFPIRNFQHPKNNGKIYSKTQLILILFSDHILRVPKLNVSYVKHLVQQAGFLAGIARVWINSQYTEKTIGQRSPSLCLTNKKLQASRRLAQTRKRGPLSAFGKKDCHIFGGIQRPFPKAHS